MNITNLDSIPFFNSGTKDGPSFKSCVNRATGEISANMLNRSPGESVEEFMTNSRMKIFEVEGLVRPLGAEIHRHYPMPIDIKYIMENQNKWMLIFSQNQENIKH